MKPVFIVLAFTIATLLNGCRKNEDGALPPPVRDPVLITSGYYYDAAGQYYKPVYWKYDKIVALPVPEQLSSYAYGIAQQGTDLIITGAYESEDGERLYPCYWRNGVKVNLPSVELEAFEKIVAKDVLDWNGTLYILGAADLAPVVWIIKNNLVVQTILVDTAFGVRSASNLHLYNNAIYIGGDKAVQQDGRTSFSVGYWKLASTGNATWHEVESDLKWATAFYLTTSSGKLFITGDRNVVNDNSLDSYMALWTKSGQLNLGPVDIPAAYRLSGVHAIGEGQLLLNAYDFNTHRPLVFRINENGEVLENIRPQIPAGFRGYCTNVAVTKGKVAMGGNYHKGSSHIFWFNVGDEIFELEQPANAVVSVTRSSWITP